MTIRAAVDQDLDEILAHNNAAVPAVNHLERAELEWFVTVAHSFRVAVDSAGMLSGFLIGLNGPDVAYESLNYRWFAAHYDRFIYVDRIVVVETGRGSGVGAALYDDFAQRGRAAGAPVMLAEVNVRPRNDGSLRFHERHGFVSVGEQDTDGGNKRVTMLERQL